MNFIQSVVGTKKIDDFKKETHQTEDKSLFEIWKKLAEPKDLDVENVNTESEGTNNSVENLSVVQEIPCDVVENANHVNTDGSSMDISNITFPHGVPSGGTSTPLLQVLKTPSSAKPSTSSSFRSPAVLHSLNISTPVKMLHWPKCSPNTKKGNAESVRQKEKVPYAITSRAWRNIFKEKEEKKEAIEQEKVARKEERERKKLEKEEIKQQKRKISKPRRSLKKLRKEEEEGTDLDMMVEPVISPSEPASPVSAPVQEITAENTIIGPGDYIVGTLIYDFGTRKDSSKNFVGKVIVGQVGRQKKQFKVHFL